MWAWAWEARDEERVGAPSTWTDEVGWAGMLTLPREVTLGPDGAVRQRPARELDALRGERTVRAEGEAAPGAPYDLGTTGRSFDLTARLQRSPDGRAAGGLRLLTSSDDSEYLDIALDPGTGELAVERSHASRDPRAKRGSWRIPRTTAPGEHVELRVLIDHSIAEVFLSSGEALTVRFYPLGEGPWRLQARAEGEGTAAVEVQAWRLNPIDVQDQSDIAQGALGVGRSGGPS
jgi:beta-fructofuranosidase